MLPEQEMAFDREELLSEIKRGIEKVNVMRLSLLPSTFVTLVN